jgi:type I restriction enzyme S subunit
MKKGWEVKKLGDVLVKTETFDPTKNPNKIFTYIDVSSVNKETKKIESVSVILGKNAPSRARKLVRTNDVIFATVRPTHSRVAKITEDYNEQICSTGYFVLRGKGIVCNQFLFYFLLTREFNEQMEKLQKGANYPAVTDSEVKNIPLHYPSSLPEQHRIVSILDTCFEAIEKAKSNAERNLQNAKELFESYLNGVFEKGGKEWELKRLGEVCEIKNGGTPRTSVLEYWDGDVAWITPADLGKLTSPLVSETPRKISKVGLEKSSAKLFSEFSVILSTRAPIGHLAINTVPMSTNQGCRGLVPSKNLNYWFLYYFLKNNIELLDSLGTGATFKELSTKSLSNVTIPLPSLPEQHSIVTQLDALQKESKRLEEHYNQKLQNLAELKKALLQKAFSGELVTDTIEIPS